MTEHDRFAEWDAAYVLGALSAADRTAYEEHLAGCEICRAAIAEVAPTIGMLSRVSPERAQGMRGEPDLESPAAEHRARVLSLAAARSRRRRRARTAAWAAAAAIVVASVAVPASWALLQPPTRTVALTQVVDLPLSADVNLADVAWGTRIELTCDYGPVADAPADGWVYALVVVADDGAENVLSTWRAHPGTTARLSAGTELASSDIASVEIRSVATGDVLMRSAIDAPEKG